MLEQSLDLFHFFIFVIPGFITVWSFRYFTDSDKSGDFEYFALSVFWGLLMLVLYASIPFLGLSFYLTESQMSIAQLLQSPYSAAIVLSFLGLLIGWIGSCLLRTKWFLKIIYWFKEFHF